MKILMTIAIVVVTGSAFAQESTVVREPTQEEKRAALLMAYKLRGNSFSGGPMVDLTNPATLAAYGNMIANETPANEQPKTVQTVEVAPTQPIRADICQRHGKRKVVTGKSWRCR